MEFRRVLFRSYSNLESVVNTALGSLGAEARALELQTEFLSQITDATEEGLGNIVDAAMARESARLTALQVSQQLGVQVLRLANIWEERRVGKTGGCTVKVRWSPYQ